eukprot:jgi/Tetstr1/429775/TSEL_019642.t1
MHAYITDMEAARREAPADIEWPELDGHHGIPVLNDMAGYWLHNCLPSEVEAFAEAVDATVLTASYDSLPASNVVTRSYDPRSLKPTLLEFKTMRYDHAVSCKIVVTRSYDPRSLKPTLLEFKTMR